MKKGFTLIELLGVIMIIALIIIIAMPYYMSSKKATTNALNDMEKENIIEAIKTAKLDYPYIETVTIEQLVQGGYLSDLNRKCSNDDIDAHDINNIDLSHIVCTNEAPDERHQYNPDNNNNNAIN